ncbi:MAG: FHA domain-containing protein [Chloroflexi bacterium]|nr:MAG: FHA domain-containing protein [Chloroflexota bacterium]
MSFEWTLFGLRLLATALLVTFLGAALFIIWKDLQRAAEPPAPAAMPHLRVLAAADDPSLAVGDLLPLQPVTKLGRDPQNTVVLHDAAASAEHACVRRHNGRWRLEDLGSRNGTLLNDLPLTKPATLAGGDVIGIGGLRFQFQTESSKPHDS